MFSVPAESTLQIQWFRIDFPRDSEGLHNIFKRILLIRLPYGFHFILQGVSCRSHFKYNGFAMISLSRDSKGYDDVFKGISLGFPMGSIVVYKESFADRLTNTIVSQ